MLNVFEFVQFDLYVCIFFAVFAQIYVGFDTLKSRFSRKILVASFAA